MMLRYCLFAAALFGTAAPAGAQRPHPDTDVLKQKSIRWLQANNPFGPKATMVMDLGEVIESQLKAGNNFSITLGPKLTKSGKSVMAGTWRDQLFVFELTDDQFKATKMKPSSAQLIPGGYVGREEVLAPAPIQIGVPKLTGGTNLDGSKEVTGEIDIDVQNEVEGPIVLRMSYSAAGRNMGKFYHLTANQLPFAGTGKAKVKFNVQGFDRDGARDKDTGKGKDKDENVEGPVILVFDLCVLENVKKFKPTQVLSNAKAVLVNVK